MALVYKDNAPVKFITGNYVGHNDRTCHTDEFLFCQYVERADTTLYQVGATANSAELVTAGDFSTACGVDWTCGTDWNIAAGFVTKVPGGAGNILTQPLCIMSGRRYQVQFTILNITAGTLSVSLGAAAIGTFTTIGTKTIFVDPTVAFSTTLIQFSDVAGTLNASMDNVSVIELSQLGYEIETDDGVSIFTDITTGVATYFELTGQISVDWTQAPVDGCYVICNHEASDYREQICNGTFDVTKFWTLSGAWTIAGGLLSIAGGGAGDFARQTFLHPLKGGRCYTLTFDTLNFGGGILDVLIQPFGSIGNVAGNGAQSFNIDLTGQPDQTILRFEDLTGALSIDIDNISILMQTVCFEEDACSECYELADDFDDFNICTQLLSWTNNDNAFGFEYENLVFTQRLRHPSELWKPNYTLDQIDHLDSAGTSTILRAQSFKVSDLDMDFMPEYLHDALRLGIRHDTFNIDAVQHFAMAQDYDPDWEAGRDSEVSTVVIPVRATTEDSVNENCA